MKHTRIISYPQSEKTGGHLNEDQLIRAIVDENDLSDTERNHLSECRLCRANILEFENLMNNFSVMAKTFAPLPRKKILLPEFPEFFRYPRLQPVFAAASVILLLLLIGILRSDPRSVQHGEQPSGIIIEMEKDEQLISEIRELEDYPIPANLYPEIFAEPVEYFNDEFLEFIAPSEEEIPRSAMPMNRLIYMSDGIISDQPLR